MQIKRIIKGSLNTDPKAVFLSVFCVFTEEPRAVFYKRCLIMLFEIKGICQCL